MDSFIIRQSWENYIRGYNPNMSSEDCNYILWEHTAFPMGGIKETENQIDEVMAKLKSGMTFRELDKERDEYISRELEKYKQTG